MKSKKSKIKYDPGVNILSLKLSRKKSVDSDIQENVVVDYDKDGNVVNIDIMDFSIEEFSRVKEFSRSHAFAEVARVSQ